MKNTHNCKFQLPPANPICSPFTVRPRSREAVKGARIQVFVAVLLCFFLKKRKSPIVSIPLVPQVFLLCPLNGHEEGYRKTN